MFGAVAFKFYGWV